MARKKRTTPDIVPAHTAPITDQKITETVEKNYMPYAMSVIISRAIPEIDGFKPAHRKVLYTMYKMGLMTGQRTKSANVVGQTMKLNPHGDASIYETLVRLTRGNESLLHPFIDSKGSFGKQYSSDMAYAASRYTEVKLDSICNEIFRGIDKNAVDFVPNYDNTMTEPVLLPTAFPNILVSANLGIAVGMASKICSFNLAEICDGTIKILKNPDITPEELLETVIAPDFPNGGSIIYKKEQLAEIYTTGRGSFTLRARYVYNKTENCIEIIQIPYSTTIEVITKKLVDLIKDGKLREISDFRDETDLSGFKLTLDLKKGTNPDALMAKLYKMTALQDDFSCNFNVLIDGAPVQTGIIGILKEWIRFRMTCVKRELRFELDRKNERLHLLEALAKILLDIDLAIKIIRETKSDKEVIPNLMDGFSIDRVQAEFIAEIRLRNLNREYILNRVSEIEELQKEIADLNDLLSSEARLKKHIAKQLIEIKKTYGMPRKTQLIYDEDLPKQADDDKQDSYPVKIALSVEGYFKKITMQSLRGNDELKFKEGDSLRFEEDSDNSKEVIFFSDKSQCYKAPLSLFDNSKASALGDYVPAKLGFDAGEKCIFMKSLDKYDPEHNIILIFENGKAVRIPVSSYETKAQRKKLTGAYSSASAVVAIFYEESQNTDIVIVSDAKTAIMINSSLIPIKTTRSSQGVAVFSLKKGFKVSAAYLKSNCPYMEPGNYKRIKIPASGIKIAEHDIKKQQIELLE